MRYLGADPTAAEDLVQETFLAACESSSAPVESLERQAAWLRGIARNLFLQHCRKNRRNRVYTDSDYVARAESVWTSEFLRDGDGFDYIEALRTCLGQLPPKQRSVVDQRYRHNLSREAMARQNDLSADGIKSLLRRIRNGLGQCIRRRLSMEELG